MHWEQMLIVNAFYPTIHWRFGKAQPETFWAFDEKKAKVR